MKKEVYEQIMNKHSLPPYEEMCELFDINTISEDTKQPLKDVTKKVYERLDLCRRIIEDFLQPETISSMEEASFFTADELNEMGSIFRILMRTDRELLLIELDNKDEDYAQYINAKTIFWKDLKEQLRPFFTKLKNGWDNRINSKPTHHYLG